MLTLIQKLHRTRLLTIPGVCRLLEAVLTTGVNLMALLRVAAKLHPERIAVTDEQERSSYAELWRQSETLAGALHAGYGVQRRQKVAIACRNNAAAIKAIFACSRLGTHVSLVNPEIGADQLRALEERLRFDFYVYDGPLAPTFADPGLSRKSLPSYHATDPSIDRLASQRGGKKVRLRTVQTGNIVVMTSGTTGQPKAASRRPSILDFLPPLAALLTRVHLDYYRTVYVATPMYHGFGLAALFMGVILGAEMYFTQGFDAARSCALIAQHKIEVVTLVPLMLQRMLNRDAEALSSLRCILSGGALLSPALARESLARLGPTLFNLYGTSEGGFAIMATPDVLLRKPESIGKPVRGVCARILNEAAHKVGDKEVGRLCVRSAWTTSKKDWIETGDLAFRDADGNLFLCGRVDDMIVSGGENVYPIELENVLLQHPEVAAVAVVGIADVEFGQRLKAVVATKKGSTLDKGALLNWLKPRLARNQIPAVVEFRDELPYTPLGKLDKNALRG
jgi:acyl-CoA synthetase (AMP-forming)/AMP-acid ligase II